MNQQYFIIYCSEDGNVSVESYDKTDLEHLITEKDYGDIEYFKKLEDDDHDPQHWGNNALIIKGEIVTPKVTEQTEPIEPTASKSGENRSLGGYTCSECGYYWG